MTLTVTPQAAPQATPQVEKPLRCYLDIYKGRRNVLKKTWEKGELWYFQDFSTGQHEECDGISDGTFLFDLFNKL